MTGSLNKSVHELADAEFAAQKKWRSFAFGQNISAYAMYIFFRSRGFATRYVLHFVTYCVELYGIALFADTDIFSTASHVTAAFFIVNLINYGGVLFYRSQLLNRAKISVQAVIGRSLFLSLPILTLSFYVGKAEFSYFFQSFLVLLIALRLIDQVCELAVMVYTADLQVRSRIYFPFWMNFVFLALVFANAAFTVFVMESVYALVVGTFVTRLCHVGYFYRQALKTRDMVQFTEPDPINNLENPTQSGNFYFSMFTVLSPIVLPLAVTILSTASHSEKMIIWILQIVLAAFVIRPFTSVMVDVFQKCQSGKFSEVRRLMRMSSRLSWLSIGFVMVVLTSITISFDLSPILVSWCGLAVISKVIIYRSFLAGKESLVYAPAMVFKYILPLSLYAYGLVTESSIWPIHAALEFCFVGWTLSAASLKNLQSYFKQRSFVTLPAHALIHLNLSVSLKTLLLIKRFRNALGSYENILMLNRRSVLVSVNLNSHPDIMKKLLMSMANWVAKISQIESPNELSKALGIVASGHVKAPLSLSTVLQSKKLSAALGSYMIAKYASLEGVDFWCLDEDETWVRGGDLNRPSLATSENIHQIAHHNFITKNVSARHYRLFNSPYAYYYVIKKFELPLVIVYSEGKNLQLSKDCRDISRWIMFHELDQVLPLVQGQTQGNVEKMAA